MENNKKIRQDSPFLIILAFATMLFSSWLLMFPTLGVLFAKTLEQQSVNALDILLSFILFADATVFFLLTSFLPITILGWFRIHLNLDRNTLYIASLTMNFFWVFLISLFSSLTM